MTRYVDFYFDFKNIFQNFLIFFIFITFSTLTLSIFLDYIYPAQTLGNKKFIDFYLTNIYFFLFFSFILYFSNNFFLKKNYLINIRIELKKFNKILNILIFLISLGLVLFLFSKIAYLSLIYNDFSKLLKLKDLSCYFIDVKNWWSLKLDVFQTVDKPYEIYIKFFNPIGKLLLSLNFTLLLFLFAFSEKIPKKKAIYTTIFSSICFIVTIILTADKILIIYLLLFLISLSPFIIQITLKSFAKFLIVLIFLFSIIVFISQQRTHCILNQFPDYSSKVEYDTRHKLRQEFKEESKFTIINKVRKFFLENDSKFASSINWINFYAISPKQTSEKIIQKYSLKFNNENFHKFEKLIFFKEILNRVIFDLNKINLSINSFLIDNEYYDRILPLSTFGVFFLNFNYFSLPIIFLFMNVILIINHYIFLRTKFSFFIGINIFVIILFSFFSTSLFIINILSTQYAWFILFLLLVTLIIVSTSSKIKIKK